MQSWVNMFYNHSCLTFIFGKRWDSGCKTAPPSAVSSPAHTFKLWCLLPWQRLIHSLLRVHQYSKEIVEKIPTSHRSPPPLTIHQGKERNTKNTTSSQSLKKKKKGLTREKTQPAKAWTFLCFSVLLLYTRSTKKESGGVRDGGIKRTLQIYMVAGTIRLSTRQHE